MLNYKEQKMKKIGTVLAALIMAFCAVAQDEGAPEQAPQDPNVQEKIRNLRIAYISEKLGLTPDQAEKFWPVYREFLDRRKEVRQELILAQRDLKQNGSTPEKENRILNLGLQIKQSELNLEKDYSERLLKIISAQQVLNLRKAEKDFQMMVLQQLQQRRMMQQRKENFRERNQQLRKRNN